MTFRAALVLLPALLVLAGCAPYSLPRLATDHPAHPEAMGAAERPFSKTLAYSPSDMPSPRPVSAVAAVQPQVPGSSSTGARAAQTVVGEGKVIAVVPNAGQIVVEHGEIKGFMEAMTMGYRIDPPSLLEGLKFGDKVRFTIDVENKAIVKIERLK
jgi:Cu/Ag efflux protein CusF